MPSGWARLEATAYVGIEDIRLVCRGETEVVPRQRRGGNYLKDNALKGRKFDGLHDLDAFLKHWNRTIARVRIHGTTRKQVQ